jgi:hypothetical protein
MNTSIWVYDPTSNAKVNLSAEVSDPTEALVWVQSVLDAGWLVEPAAENLDRIEVDFVIRSQQPNKDDDTVTPKLAFYKAGLEFKMLTVYLNNQDDRDDFQKASGLNVDHLPLWEAAQFPANDDPVFKKYAVKTNFQCTRKKVEMSKSVSGFVWRLVGYGPAAPTALAPLSEVPRTEDTPPTSDSSPTWWNHLLQNRASFGKENAQHAANSLKELIRDGLLTDDMSEAVALKTAQEIYELRKSDPEFGKVSFDDI